ncbi:MAG: zinc-binding dehydrogenase [Planctomycetes bacterium]|nr:zinc-binding dehydrogenase [Planctomycetota bacterium]
MVQKGFIQLVEIEEPRLGPPQATGEEEIIFQPEITCLCGSDLPYFCEEQPSYPLDVGLSLHEMVGTVVETTGRRFRAGQKVLAVPVAQVGLFERLRLSEARAIPLDPRRPLEAVLLAQPLGTVIYALKKVPQVLDLDVAVVGQGPMGQIWCAVLRMLGAREIIALDVLDARLAMSPRMGATAVVNPAREDAAAAVASITDGAMADLVIEAVGHASQALDLCSDLAKRGGRILYFGVPPDKLREVRWRDLFFKNVTVHTSVNPDFARDFPLAMRWIGEGRIDLTPLITHRFQLREIQRAFETFRDKAGGALKVMVRFPAAG